MKNVKMKRKQLVQLWNHIVNFKGKYNKLFIYGLVKIKLTIRDEIFAIHEAQQIKCEEYIQYQQEYSLLTAKYAVKDEENNPIIINGMIKIRPDVTEEAKKALSDLFEKYKSVIAAYNKEEKELEKFLEEEVEFCINPIYEYLPDDLTIEEIEGFELIL